MSKIMSKKEGHALKKHVKKTINYPVNRVFLDIFLGNLLQFYISKTPWF